MNMIPAVKDLEYICKLMYETYKIPIFFLDSNGEIVLEFSSNYVHHPLYASKQGIIQQLFHPDDPQQFPIFRTTNYLESFFSICLKDNDGFQGVITMGPTLSSPLSEVMIKGLINDFHLHKEQHSVIHYYQSLPVLNSLKFIHISMLLYYMIYKEQLDIPMILQHNKTLDRPQVEMENPDLAIAERRQNTFFHHDPIYEKRIMQFVKEGRKEEVIKHWRSAAEEGGFGTLSKNSQLRSQKNLAITSITLITRAAMEGGLYPEAAYTLSDFYIQNIEELTTSKDVDHLLEDALYDFTERVQNVQRQKYSKPIHLCQSYIFTHLYEEITLADLANVTGMNPRYISSLFKKEVGISISEYIQRERVEEAKNLMTLTNHSLAEIYSMLTFHDQSHFTKVFKKFTGVTPKQFKDKPLKI
jgi:YSIRK-targeted surface antigen transcriptional regulator